MQFVYILAIILAVVGVFILVTVLALLGGGGGGDAQKSSGGLGAGDGGDTQGSSDTDSDMVASDVYGWNGLLRAVQESETRVIFTYSFVRADVVVSDLELAAAGPMSTSTVTTDTFSMPGSCAIDVEVEIRRAMTWWAQCMQNALGVEVVFRSLGLENHNPLTATPTAVLSQTQKTNYNIGDIRIASWDFEKLNSDNSQMHPSFYNAVMYAFPGGPSNVTYHNYQYYNAHDYIGNVYINSGAQTPWRSVEQSSSCGFELAHVMAHELGHVFGLFHDCDEKGDVTANQNMDCVNNVHDGELVQGGSSIMLPMVSTSGSMPTNCNNWIEHHLSKIYSTEHLTLAATRAELQNSKKHSFRAPFVCPRSH